MVIPMSLLMSCGNAWVAPSDAVCVVLSGPVDDLNASVVSNGEVIISAGAGEVIANTRDLTVVYDAACDTRAESP